TKMAIHALEQLGLNLNKEHEDLIVFVEIGRCMADAIQVVTKYRIGKKSLIVIDHGKYAATFYKKSTGEGIRLTDEDIKNQKTSENGEELVKRLSEIPNEELFSTRKVKIDLEKLNYKDKKFNKIVCPICNEVVKDNKYIIRNGESICKSCAEESYYEFIN
ncbi:MAG: FmdE family protein, partial [Methanobrevibacter sp.]|nr:FmdE family protein [Methanobrevibacter sp.]